ncbi:MAG: phage Gp37/Gp68 family protein [Verrucomicrobiota bacterium]
MATNSSIEWCDHTFNGWEGCTKVSPGCANCYAENRNSRFNGGSSVNWGKGAPRRKTSDNNWKLPLRWNREAEADLMKWEVFYNVKGPAHCPRPRRPRVFSASLADWLDPEIPIEWLVDLLFLVQSTPSLDWLLLTKRPELWYDRIADARLWVEEAHTRLAPLNRALSNWLGAWLDEWHGLRKVAQSGTPHNVWIGTSVEDQIRADQRIPALLKIPAKVRFLSCEPLLGEVDINHYLDNAPLDGGYFGRSLLDWVIVGGESGPNARPMHPDWARSLRDQCQEAGVPFFFKQWGEWAPWQKDDYVEEQWCVKPDGDLSWVSGDLSDGILNNWSKNYAAGDHVITRVGKKAAGRLLDLREWNELPMLTFAPSSEAKKINMEGGS